MFQPSHLYMTTGKTITLTIWTFVGKIMSLLLTCIQISQEAGKVVWYSHLLKNFPQFVVIHTVKAFSVVNEAEVDVFSGTLFQKRRLP